MSRKNKLEPFENQIVEEYSKGKSTVELGKEYGVNAGSIYYCLKKNNVQVRNRSEAQRKYTIREDYFDKIDTCHKAYILGLLYSDGCNSTESNCVRIVLTAQDKHILEDISSLIYVDHRNLTYRKGHEFVDKGKTYFSKDSCVFTINNKRISENLCRWGVVKNKTQKIIFPTWLKPIYVSHFIRGYFDGDGSISISNCQAQVSILGTKAFCTVLNKYLYDKGIKSSVCKGNSEITIYQICIHGNQCVRKFLEFVYDKADLYLSRKKMKSDKILKIIPLAKRETCKLCSMKHFAEEY